WTGQPVRGKVAADAERWALMARMPEAWKFLKPPPPADPKNWKDPQVGWGLVLPQRPGLAPQALATADDAPGPMPALLQARPNPPVFRYRADWKHRFTQLTSYAAKKDVAVSGAPIGIRPDGLPRYLLLCGGPDEIPW